MEIRKLAETELEQALELARRVFFEFEAPDYPEEGVASFLSALRDPEYLAALTLYGAFVDDALIGTLATRNTGEHIALFFVDPAYHRQGVGRQLFTLAAADNVSGRITVNASPYALEIYRRLGFHETASEQITGGLRYTPMACTVRNPACPCRRSACPRRGDCVACRAHHRQDPRHPVFCERS